MARHLGGSLSGRYCYTGFCVDESRLLQSVKSACTGLGGTVVLSNTTGTVNGTLDFAAGFVTRNATLVINGTATVPAVCAAVGCATVQSAFTSAGATASCSASGGGCSCTYSITTPAGNADAFTTAGSTVTVGSRTFEYCAQSGLVYRETTNNPAEPGIATLSR